MERLKKDENQGSWSEQLGGSLAGRTMDEDQAMVRLG